ncbi:hypothetical protein TSUD_369180 [Trifolium subterraneum]|uniref:Uncharacterized protein n=1 Tax=Trifolium subterraneum TaxID=3900 RepID=A0A2Z6PBW5_TRISU|nr:hypothetical protein TSUD_369180 [Trifolium subterraneum]
MLEIERDIMQHGVRFQAYLAIGNQPASCWPGRPYRITISGDVRTREKEPVSLQRTRQQASKRAYLCSLLLHQARKRERERERERESSTDPICLVMFKMH